MPDTTTRKRARRRATADRSPSRGAAEGMAELADPYRIPTPAERQLIRKLYDHRRRLGQIPPEELGEHPALVKRAAADYDSFARVAEVDTEPDGAVFWSGGTQGAGAMAEEHAAARTAAGHPTARLEGTPGGKRLASLAEGVDFSITQNAFSVASRRFADRAEGAVDVYVKEWPRDDAELLRELNRLDHNDKVTDIRIHSVATEPYTRENGRVSDRLVRDQDGKGVIQRELTLEEVFAHYKK